MNIENPDNVSGNGYKRTQQSKRLSVWIQFCEFTKKTENFTHNDAAEFFESLLKRLSLNGVYRYEFTISNKMSLTTIFGPQSL